MIDVDLFVKNSHSSLTALEITAKPCIFWNNLKHKDAATYQLI